MKISELSRRSGVPVASIKFYIREGLLPPGARTAKNQARYSEAHLGLLDLIRVLKDDLGMSVSTIAHVFAADPRRGHEFVADGLEAIEASSPKRPRVDRTSAEYKDALGRVRAIMREMRWVPRENDVRFEDLVDAVATVIRIWPFGLTSKAFFAYAKAAAELAVFEIPEDWDPAGEAVRSFKFAVLGTYLFEPVLLGFRRLAHVERSRALSEARAKRETGKARPAARDRAKKRPQAK